MTRLFMLDLCAGLGGASQAMRDRGWEVITLDNDPRFGCTCTADLCEWSWSGRRPDLIWLSDPCTEFARESMPWSHTGRAPDLSIFHAGMRVIRETRPRYWVRENVRGSIQWVRPFIGIPQQHIGPYFLWGNIPPLGVALRGHRNKESYSSTRPDLRAMIPTALSLAVAIAIETQQELVLV